MDDLISREALVETLKAREKMYAECTYDAYNYHIAAEIVANAESVPAVPLDKLCVWLADNAYMYLTEKELDAGYSSHDPVYWEMKLKDWMEPKMPDIQSAIDHIKTAVDIDPWAAEMAKKALKKEIPRKWEYDRPGHWRCPACGIMMGRNILYNKYCYNCGQKCEGADKYED